ncbi:PX domain-containing protein 1 isoform X1 [Canis lupus baileyi]|uniref:PX domain-containing protein 1 isoform X1 n=1 Tax=Canis lupus baileyi TaxID=143281 RepID=UPI003B96F768
MASAVFEGTSLVNMFVRGCWVNGVRRLIVGRRGDEEDFFEIRTEWSDRSVLYLHRSLADLGRLWQRLRDAFPEDRPELARAPLRQGLVAIKDAHDIETRLNEVEKLLKTIISMPCKYSRSEVVLTFFERSPLDQVLKNDNVHKIQPSFQSPVKISEIMRSNGFCLANTETIVIDHSIPNGKDQHLGVDPTEHLPVQRAHWLSCGLARGGHQGPDGCASGARPEDRCFSFIGRASGLRVAGSSAPSSRMATTQQPTSPTCPITTWSPSRRTFWTESPLGAPGPPLPAAQARVGAALRGLPGRGAFRKEARPQVARKWQPVTEPAASEGSRPSRSLHARTRSPPG